MAYALLGARSHFSLTESILKIDQLVSYAAEKEYSCVEMADTMTLSGVTEFVTACVAKGLTPLVGVRLRVVPDAASRDQKGRADPQGTFYPKVYPINESGRRRLFEMLSRAYSPENFYYVPRIGYPEFKELMSHDDLIVRTGDMQGLFALPLETAGELLTGITRSRIFVDITPIRTPYFDRVNEIAYKFAIEQGLYTLISRPILYPNQEFADSRDVAAAILSNQKMNSPTRHIPWVRDLDLANANELGGQVTEMCKRIPSFDVGEVYGRCGGVARHFADALGGLNWGKLPVSLPSFGEDEFTLLVTQCKNGWARLKKPMLGFQPAPEDLLVYKERLQYELGVIRKMGFVRYFLVVGDLVKWAKMNHILVGPGRGSVGGSLVAYLMGITDVDPIRFNLLFERFINPERIDLPDADLDFQSDRRDEVIRYLEEKYGIDNVAGISNFVALQAASAIRDVGRVYDIPMHDVSCSKFVPKEHGISSTLDEAADAVPAIEAFKKKYPTPWRHAVNLEGTIRNFGRHAAGVIVAGEPIVHRAVVETHKNDRAVNWDKIDVEHWGLVKIDVLGLTTLQVINIALDYIGKSPSMLLDLPLDDERVLNAFGKGKTTGVFQFESPGMKGLLKDLAFERTLTFEDLVAATSLYRPGPKDSGLLEEYVAIKQGLRRPHYDHPELEKALHATEGVMIYQEQVMDVFRRLAGFTMAEADNARKAMGKKDKEKMEKLRITFVDGAEKHSGFERERGDKLFDKIMNFAAYGFNRSHAVEYSVISYWCMWLKEYHPGAFYAAALTALGEDKLEGLVRDARAHDLEILPPDINRSTDKFEIVLNPATEKWCLLTPFHRCKSVSETATALILSIRDKDGPFTDYDDFKKRMPSKLNTRQRSVLDKVGAFVDLKKDPKGATHPDRRKDQIELMPGLIIDNVRSARPDIPVSACKDALIKDVLVPALRGCEKCSLKGGVHPTPRLGKRAKFMVVTDCPNWGEEAAAKMLEGKPNESLRQALKAADLSISDGYFTSMVKSPKADKTLTNEQINGCLPYLLKEIEILKPPVIVALGGLVARQLVPDLTNVDDAVGRVVYDAKSDANIVVGFSPLRIHFDASKQDQLEEIFRKVAELIE